MKLAGFREGLNKGAMESGRWAFSLCGKLNSEEGGFFILKIATETI